MWLETEIQSKYKCKVFFFFFFLIITGLLRTLNDQKQLQANKPVSLQVIKPVSL